MRKHFATNSRKLASSLLGVKQAEIGETLDYLELRLAHQVTFQQARDQMDEREWERVIELLARIPDESFYTQRSKLIIEESKRNILELQLETDRTARHVAEETAITEKQARLLAEDRADKEAELRVLEELERQEAEAKSLEDAHLRAIEEVAKKAAESRADEEALLRAN